MPTRMLKVEVGCGRGDRSAEKEARAHVLRFARGVAIRAGRRHPQGYSTADDVVAGLVRHGHPPAVLGSTMGSVFRTPEWRRTRWRVRSRRPASHGREIMVWQLAEVRECRKRAKGPSTCRLPPGISFLVDGYLPRLQVNGAPVHPGWN